MKLNRPPVVAVLGHVDHGKTTLLDSIRKTNEAGSEPGGITQKIGAYQIEINFEGENRKITFIDTPGHEAFLAMRSRGVSAADIAILVIAANENVKPQTKESIKHIKESKIPFIVALTKSDLPSIQPTKIKQELAKEEVLVEELGGKIPCILVSAKTGKGVKELLDMILLVWDMQEKKEEPEFRAVVIESKLSPRKGILATLVIKSGELGVKDEVFFGTIGLVSKIRAIISPQGKQVNTAQAGDAVEVLGFAELPKLGEVITRQKPVREDKTVPLEKALKTEHPKQALSIILKADTLGSIEAILASLSREVLVVSANSGLVGEGDITNARAHGAIIIAYNVRVGADIFKFAKNEKVIIKQYNLIYELLDQIRETAQGLLEIETETILGKANVLASFPFEKTKVLGLRVFEGRVALGDKIRLIREEQEIGESTIRSMRRGKENLNVAEKGTECGVVISPMLDFEVGDMLLSYHV